jgi:DNA primase
VPRHSETTLSAIKNAIDIVALVGEYLSLRRSGTRYKALCPFHDDHNPSLEVNPERQSYKCWVCGSGGDVFDFVQNIEHVDFPEALRMLADRAGVALENQPSAAAQPRGPSKSELFEVNAWAEQIFAKALEESTEVKDYLERRGLTQEMALRFRLGHAPADRGWLLAHARRKRLRMEVLEQAGLVSQSPDSPGLWRERFRGRLIFPIRDDRGRPIGFGGRILPEVERVLAAQGKQIAKYINSPETPLFHKRTLLYGADLGRAAARETGWVAVVEGYTDVIAAHQVGLCNVVGTLGTAIGEEHLRALRRLADDKVKVVLVFDGDDAGQSAADRALEFFLASELDLRVLTLPWKVDPCEFLLKEGADAFRALAERAVEPPAYLLSRAAARFDLSSIEGARRAAEWVLGIISRVPDSHHIGVEFKKAKVLDTLSFELGVPREALKRWLRPAAKATASSPIRQSDLDPVDVEFIWILLHEPTAITSLIPRIAVSTLRDAPLRTILQAFYDLQKEGQTPSYENLMVRLDDPAIRGLATDLVSQTALLTPDPAPAPSPIKLHSGKFAPVCPAPWHERLQKMLIVLDEREQRARLSDLKKVKDETDPHADPDAYRAIELEYHRLLTSRRTRKT